MGIHFLFLLYFLTMKYLSFIFALAILSAPLAAETLTAATLNAFDAADSSDDSMDADAGAIALLWDTFGAAHAGDGDGPNANLITSADWLAGRNPLFTDAVITEILSVSIADTSATVDALVTALNTIVEELYQCVTEAHAAESSVPLVRYLVLTMMKSLLSSLQVHGLLPPVIQRCTDGITALGYAGCTNEYALIRGLWDSSVVPAATLTAGGLTATFIPTLLAAYE